jgi:hypothetical protein
VLRPYREHRRGCDRSGKDRDDAAQKQARRGLGKAGVTIDLLPPHRLTTARRRRGRVLDALHASSTKSNGWASASFRSSPRKKCPIGAPGRTRRALRPAHDLVPIRVHELVGLPRAINPQIHHLGHDDLRSAPNL